MEDNKNGGQVQDANVVPDNGTGTTPENGGQAPQDGQVTMESLLVQLQELRADNAKLKNTNDRLSSDAGTLRKQLREKMTAEERENEAKAEREASERAANEAVKRELEILKGTNRYLKMGFDETLAQETATAAYEHDQATVDANFAKWQTEREKAMEARIRDELIKSLPEPKSGNQSGIDFSKQLKDTREAGNRSGYVSAVFAQGRANGFGR